MSEREVDAELVARVQRGDKKAFDLLVLEVPAQDPAPAGPDDPRPIGNRRRGPGSFHQSVPSLAPVPGRQRLLHLVVSYRHQHGAQLAGLARPAPQRPNAIETEDGETFNETDNLTDISTPESMVASREIAETVNAAIEELPEELRTAIVLREIEGMSYEDIAQSMDCPIGTVRSRIFRAREAIATKLRPLLGTDAERRW